jgi:hypothetical protein
MFAKNDMFGAMRSASLVLKRATTSAQEAWMEEEVMLNPRECAQMNALIKECEGEIKRMKNITGKFCAVAGNRMAGV